MSPVVISSSPAISRRPVDLPQPDGPTRTRNSLSWTWTDRSLTASTSPNRLVTWSSSTPAIRVLRLVCAWGSLWAQHSPGSAHLSTVRAGRLSSRRPPAGPPREQLDGPLERDGGVDQDVRARDRIRATQLAVDEAALALIQVGGVEDHRPAESEAALDAAVGLGVDGEMLPAGVARPREH